MLRSPLVRNLLLLLAVVFFLLRFFHLTADYPTNIRWDDGIATDEGWYASGAVNQQTWGHPLLQGDMNIPVIMPLWSVIAEAAFRLGGFHVVSLRVAAILFFFLCTGFCCILLRRYGAAEWIPLFLAMFAMNPWAFTFSRAAFLEFPMLSLCLLSAVLIPEKASTRATLFRILCAGVAFALAMLLKTTALAMSPLLVYVIAERDGFQLRRSIRDVFTLFCAATAVYGTYWLLVVRPHEADVQFYLSVVQNTLRFTPYGFIADTSRPFRYGLGSDHLLFLLSLLTIAASLFVGRVRSLWKEPLFALSGVWLIAFVGFMVKHNNDPARYFAITIPACLFMGIALLRNSTVAWPRAVRQALLVLITLDIGSNGAQILYGLSHARYSFHNAATEIARTVREHDGPRAVIVGDNMHELALHNGLRPVNLLFHSDSVTEQMARYQPQWWVQFSPIDDGRCFREVLSKAYTADRRGEWQIFYPGQKLVLWKLSPAHGGVLPARLTSSQLAACKPPVYN